MSYVLISEPFALQLPFSILRIPLYVLQVVESSVTLTLAAIIDDPCSWPGMAPIAAPMLLTPLLLRKDHSSAWSPERRALHS